MAATCTHSVAGVGRTPAAFPSGRSLSSSMDSDAVNSCCSGPRGQRTYRQSMPFGCAVGRPQKSSERCEPGTTSPKPQSGRGLCRGTCLRPDTGDPPWGVDALALGVDQRGVALLPVCIHCSIQVLGNPRSPCHACERFHSLFQTLRSPAESMNLRKG